MALKDKQASKSKKGLEEQLRNTELELQMSLVDNAGKAVTQQSKELSDQIDRQDEQVHA